MLPPDASRHLRQRHLFKRKDTNGRYFVTNDTLRDTYFSSVCPLARSPLCTQVTPSPSLGRVNCENGTTVFGSTHGYLYLRKRTKYLTS